MPTIRDVADVLDHFAPASLAESWDNVGLLVGNRDWNADKVMTCLTITPTTVAEAVERQANLIVTHHPLPFTPLKTITTETTVGRMLLELITAGIGVYSPHTAFDSAQAGINQHWAMGLDLQEIRALVPLAEDADAEVGTGRMGLVGGSPTLAEMAQRVKTFLDVPSVRVVGADDQSVNRVAVACGSGGSFLESAVANRCDCFITGETTYHTCLEAEAQGIGLILPGHFASERFAMRALADYLGEQVPGVDVWTSSTERDPLRTV